jgi:RES domain-containing protein
MVIWRISRHRDLAGVGGLRAAGRWHHAGQPVVYLSESPASALLEVCVHTAANDIPPELTLLKVEGPDLEIASVPVTDPAANWSGNLEMTRDLGSGWLRNNEGVLLRVPSAIVPETSNYLLNPLHADANRFAIVEVERLGRN